MTTLDEQIDYETSRPGPTRGGPLGHGTRCRCSPTCRTHANGAATKSRTSKRANGYVFHRGIVSPPPRPARQRKYDWAEIANIATEARTNGTPMGHAVAARYNTTATNASGLIERARKAGHHIPAGDKASHSRGRPATGRNVSGMPRAAKPINRKPVGEWADLAECRGIDPELFHPKRGESASAAKAVCRTCPVRAECLEHALVNLEKIGVWGGASERERRRMRAVKRQAVTA